MINIQWLHPVHFLCHKRPKMNETLPDSDIPWWNNHYEGTYSEDPENGSAYDVGTKVQA